MRLHLACAVLVGCASSTTQSAPPQPVVAPIAAMPAVSAPPAGPMPPVAEQRPYEVKSPNGSRIDPYYWLRDDARKDPKVLGYLEAENAYAQAVLAPHKALEDTLFAEMRSRIKEDDASVPVLDAGYWYYTRYETGKQHPIYARRKGAMTATEEIILDANQLAAGHGFYKIGRYAVSPNGKLVAYGEDTVGRNQFTLRIKDLTTGQLLADTAENIQPSFAWGNDNKTLFYVGKDPVTLRQDRVFRHVLGGKSELVYEEKDGQYYVGISAAKSRKYVIIIAAATTNTEVRLIDANKPAAAPKVFLKRSQDHLYEVQHVGNRFLMRTNDGGAAKNFKIVEVTPANVANRKAWKDVVPHRDDTLVEEMAAYESFLAVNVRTGGLRKVMVLPNKKPSYLVDAQDASYAMTLVDTPDTKATKVRYTYDAMQTPSTVFEVDVATKARTQLKQQPVPGYDASKYASEYIHATAKDGTKVPVSLVYRKDTPRDGTASLLIYGYGSYGYSIEPRFDSDRLALLDRGFVWAIAHIRGGEEMGRAWYEDGKLMKKMNTFTDFIAVTEHLVAQKYAAPDQVFAHGGSAGGLLLGAVVNMRPDLYRGIVSFVPFVDVVTVMLDETIPLTTNEFDEWGNPKDKAAYDYMLAYSPYDNIKAQAYPAIFVRTGLWDSQVQYFEPAKWVAKLRAAKTDKNPLVFETDMKAGHGGASGRFDKMRQLARAMAFVLHVRATPDARK